MPRTKQQRPMHIMDHKSTEDIDVKCNEDTSPISPYEFSSPGSTASSQESHLKHEEDAVFAGTLSPAARSSTPAKSEGICSEGTAGTPAESESDSRSRYGENDREDNGSTNLYEEAPKDRFSPFVDMQNFPWKGKSQSPLVTGEKKHFPEFVTSPNNIHDVGFLGWKNGFNNLAFSQETFGNGLGVDTRNPQFATILRNMLPNPLQLMAKLLYSHKNDTESRADKSADCSENTGPKILNATEPSTLDAIRNHILDKKNAASVRLQEPSRSKNSTPEFTVPSPAEIECGQTKDHYLSNSGDVFAPSGNKLPKPFLSIQEMISGRKENCLENQVQKKEVPQVKVTPSEFPTLAFPSLPSDALPQRENGTLKQAMEPKFPDKNVSSPPNRDNTKSACSDRSPVVSPSLDTHHKFVRKDLIPPFPNPYLPYHGKIRPNGSKRGREKYPGPYGFYSFPVSPHGRFPAALPSLHPDFLAMAPPYYSPWGMMHPLHSGIDGIQTNPVFQTMQPAIPMWQPKLSNKRSSPSGHTSPRPASNVSYQSPVPNPRKSGPPRVKIQPTNPIDSLHAAIVKEAKEMNKGMDPENMYIECPICHKKIKRLYHFQRHMRIHSGEKSHTCPFCPYKSVRKDNLKSHMKTHEKTKYDGSRRVQQQRREGRSPFPQRSEFRLPIDQKENGNSPTNSTSSSPPNGVTFLTLPSKQGILPAISPPIHHCERSNEELLDFSANKIPNVNDMTLLPPSPYISKSGFPYPGYPVIPPFPQLLERERRRPQTSSAQITEIDDRMPEPESKADAQKVMEKCEGRYSSSYKRQRDENPTPYEPKRHRTSPTNVEEALLLGNSNNSNNLERKPLQIYSPTNDHVFNGSTGPGYAFKIKDSFKTKETVPRCFYDNAHNVRSEEDISKEEYCASIKQNTTPNQLDVKPSTQQNGDFQFDSKPSTYGIPSFIPGKTELENRRNDSLDQESSKGKKRADAVITNSPPGISSSPPATTLAPPSSGIGKIDSLKMLPLGEDESGKTSENEPKPMYIKSEVTSSSDSTPRCNTSSTWMNSQKESKCRLCDFSAPNNSSLQEHMASHKEDGMYKCQQCEYHGKNLSKLIEHIRIHTGERPFQCDQCSYAAKRKDNLAQHKSVRHDKNRFKGPARVLKLSGQQEYDACHKSPTNRTVPQRNLDYPTIEIGSAVTPPKARAENTPTLACGEWITKFGHDRVSVPLAEEKFTAEQREKGLLTSRGSPSLFNPLAYPFLSYNKMTSSFLCGHPLMTPTVFPPFSTLPTGENAGIDISPASSATPTGRMNSKPSFAKSLQECAR